MNVNDERGDDSSNSQGNGNLNCDLLAPRQLVIAGWSCTFLMATYGLYFARSLLVPLVISLLAYLAMRPFVGRMKRLGIPAWTAAAIVTFLFGGAVVVTSTMIAGPAQYWFDKAPRGLNTIGPKLATLKRPLEIFDTAEKQIEKLTESEDLDAPLKVEVTAPSIVDKQTLFSNTGQLLAFLFAIAVMSFFLLASDDDLLRRLIRTLPTLSDRKKALAIVYEIQDMVGSYLSLITFINFGLGCCVALMTWLCGMPTPLLWGVIAMLMNYIPFVGAFIGAGVVFLASAMEFDQLWWAVVITSLYLTLTSIEANFVTPMILGRTMKLGPVMVLLAVAFWGFLWGLPGVIVAVPMLMVVRQICASFKATRAIAILLGDECMLEDDAEACRDQKEATLEQEQIAAKQAGPVVASTY